MFPEGLDETNHKIYNLIPNDSEGIRHGKLIRLCVKEGIGRATAENRLSGMVNDEYVKRIVVEDTKPPGTRYVRALNVKQGDVPIWSLIFNPLMKVLVKNREKGIVVDPDGKLAAKDVYCLLSNVSSLLCDEIMRYINTADKEQAKKRLDAIVAYHVSEMVKQIADYAEYCGKDHTAITQAISQAFLAGSKNWDEIWENASIHDAEADKFNGL